VQGVGCREKETSFLPWAMRLEPFAASLYCLRSYKSLCALRKRRKKQPQRTQRPPSFFDKGKKYISFYGHGLLFAFRSSDVRDKKMNEEEAESAEIVP
jgi:hypothetical protein